MQCQQKRYQLGTCIINNKKTLGVRVEENSRTIPGQFIKMIEISGHSRTNGQIPGFPGFPGPVATMTLHKLLNIFLHFNTECPNKSSKVVGPGQTTTMNKSNKE